MKVINYKYLPVRFPLWPTVIAALTLDRLNAPGWAWGVGSTVFVLLWILAFVAFYKQETVNPKDL